MSRLFNFLLESTNLIKVLGITERNAESLPLISSFFLLFLLSSSRLFCLFSFSFLSGLMHPLLCWIPLKSHLHPHGSGKTCQHVSFKQPQGSGGIFKKFFFSLYYLVISLKSNQHIERIKKHKCLACYGKEENVTQIWMQDIANVQSGAISILELNNLQQQQAIGDSHSGLIQTSLSWCGNQDIRTRESSQGKRTIASLLGPNININSPDIISTLYMHSTEPELIGDLIVQLQCQAWEAEVCYVSNKKTVSSSKHDIVPGEFLNQLDEI